MNVIAPVLVLKVGMFLVGVVLEITRYWGEIDEPPYTVVLVKVPVAVYEVIDSEYILKEGS